VHRIFCHATLEQTPLPVAGGILQRTLTGLLILVLEHEAHVAAELEHAFNSAGAHAWVIGSLQRAIDLVKPGGWSAVVVDGDAREPGRMDLFGLLRERNIPFVVHSYDPITEGEFAQVPHVRKPVPPSKIVQVIEEMLHPGVNAHLP
jgi:hypothetical protein